MSLSVELFEGLYMSLFSLLLGYFRILKTKGILQKDTGVIRISVQIKKEDRVNVRDLYVSTYREKVFS